MALCCLVHDTYPPGSLPSDERVDRLTRGRCKCVLRSVSGLRAPQAQLEQQEPSMIGIEELECACIVIDEGEDLCYDVYKDLCYYLWHVERTACA